MIKLNSNSPTDELLKGMLEITKELKYRFKKKSQKENINFINAHVGALDRALEQERKK